MRHVVCCETRLETRGARKFTSVLYEMLSHGFTIPTAFLFAHAVTARTYDHRDPDVPFVALPSTKRAIGILRLLGPLSLM